MKKIVILYFAVLAGSTALAQHVGIGTTNPSADLEVKAPTGSTIKIRNATYLDTTKLIFSNRFDAGFGTDMNIKMVEERGLYFSSASDMPDNVNDSIFVLTAKGFIGAGGAPDTSALLDLKSTKKGLLVPRMSSVQRTNIANPANGLLVYDLSTQTFWYRKGAAWEELNKAPVTKYLTVPVASFRPLVAGGGQLIIQPHQLWMFTGAVENLIAPVYLPHGAKIKDIAYSFIHNAAPNMKMGLYLSNSISDGYSTISEYTTNNISASAQIITSNFSDFIADNQNETYFILLSPLLPDTWETSFKFRRVVISYEE